MTTEEKQQVLEEFDTWINHPYTKRVINKFSEDELLLLRTAANNPNGDFVKTYMGRAIQANMYADELKKPLVSLIETTGGKN